MPVHELAVLHLVGDEGQRDVPGHLRVADECVLFGGPHVDHLDVVRRRLPHLVGLRGGHVETKRRLLHLGELAGGDRGDGLRACAATGPGVAATSSPRREGGRPREAADVWIRHHECFSILSLARRPFGAVESGAAPHSQTPSASTI